MKVQELFEAKMSQEEFAKFFIKHFEAEIVAVLSYSLYVSSYVIDTLTYCINDKKGVGRL